MGRGRPSVGVAGPVGACPTRCGRGRPRGGVAGPVGVCPVPWVRGQTDGGVASPVGAWPARANFFFGRTFDLVSDRSINYACAKP